MVVQAFVDGGGRLLLSHEALKEENGNFALADTLGIDYVGAADSNPGSLT